MEMTRQRFLSTLFAVMFASASAGDALATEHDAFTDFPSSTNAMDDVWQFGYSRAPLQQFRAFTNNVLDGMLSWWNRGFGNPNVKANLSGSDWEDEGAGTLYPGSDYLQLQPGSTPNNRYTVLRFRAPESGTWWMSMGVRSLRLDGGPPCTSYASVNVGGAQQWAQAVTGHYSDGESGTYDTSFYLEAGDTVDFAVGPGPSSLFDNTGIRATLTLEGGE